MMIRFAHLRPHRLRSCRTVRVLLLLTCSVCLPTRVAGDSKVKQIIAFSMREAQQVGKISSEGSDLSTTHPEVFFLGGITWPWAVVLDSETHDLILVGERDPEHSILTLDDWIVAIRARFLFPEADPGVTLMPTVEDCDRVHILECLLRPHHVEFFAGIDGTEFGATCLAADVLLKRISLGLEPIPEALKLESFSSLMAQDETNRYSLIGNRFWIYPLISEVNVVDNVAVLERFHLGVLTEVMYANDSKGEAIDLPYANDYLPASRFAKDMSDAFPSLAKKWRELDRVQGLGRLAGLAKALRVMSVVPDIQTILSTFRPKGVQINGEVNIQRIQVTPGREIFGGVELDALVNRIQKGDLAALRELVLTSRPRKSAVSWEFTAVVEDGRLAAVRYASAGIDTAKMAPLLRQARFLSARGYYKPAIHHFDDIIKEFPDHEEALTSRAIALSKSDQKAAALRDADHAVSIKGSDEAYVLRAVLRALDGSDSAALKDLDNAIRVNPSAIALFLRGILYWRLSEAKNDQAAQQRALADLNNLLVLVPGDPMATLYRGFIYLTGEMKRKSPGSLTLAVADFSKVLSVKALRIKALLGRGLALVLMKEYKAALADLDEAVNAFPEDSIARLARAEAREALRQYVGAEVDRRKGAQGRV